MDDEKWKVNADALEFAETNSHILEKAKLFGERPTQGVYGYSCWDGDEGIVSFRNPTEEEKEYTLELTDMVGVPKSVKDIKGNQVLPYVVGDSSTVSYGDTLTVKLAPYETRIFQYGKNDSTGAEIISAKVTGNNEITVKYNERVENGKEVYSVEGNNITETKLLDDYRTVVITTKNRIVDKAKLNITGERDAVGNKITKSLEIPAYSNGKVANVTSGNNLVDGENIEKSYNGDLDMFLLNLDKDYTLEDNKSFTGTNDFAISMAVKTTSNNVNLLSQGDDISLSIDEEGYVSFKVKDLKVNSKSEVTTVIEKAHGIFGTDKYVPTSTSSSFVGKVNDGDLHQVVAVREVNGMLKIYIDGELSNSVYDENRINQSIESGKIVVADNSFKGILGGIELRNSSIYYDEAKSMYEPFKGSEIIEIDKSNWKANACSEMPATSGDGQASTAIDGNESSWWHTNYVGGDSHEGNHWIQVDFGDETSFDTINILSRGKNSNGTIKDYKLDVKVNGQWKEIKTGTFESGINDSIIFEEAITASAIRITALSTFNGKDFAAIKEITLTNKDRLATKEEIDDAKELVKDIDENNYTIVTAERYNEIALKLNLVSEINTIPLKKLIAQLEEVYSSLLDAKELNALLKEINSLNKEEYTLESWYNLENEVLKANAVVRDIYSTEKDVTNSYKTLKEAYNNLKLVGTGNNSNQGNDINNGIGSEGNNTSKPTQTGDSSKGSLALLGALLSVISIFIFGKKR